MPYQSIDKQIWQVEIKRLSKGAKFFYLYLLTNHHSNVSGCYILPLAYIKSDTDLNEREIKESIIEIVNAGLMLYDEPSEVVCLLTYFKHNNVINKAQIGGAEKYILALPESKIRNIALNLLISDSKYPMPTLSEKKIYPMTTLPEGENEGEDRVSLLPYLTLPIDKPKKNILTSISNSENGNAKNEKLEAKASAEQSSPYKSSELVNYLEIWNNFAEKQGLATVNINIFLSSNTRKKKLKFRIKEWTNAQITMEEILISAAKLDHPMGRSVANWRMDIEYLIANDNNWIKLLERGKVSQKTESSIEETAKQMGVTYEKGDTNFTLYQKYKKLYPQKTNNETKENDYE